MGTLHHRNGKFALPGGSIDHGENAEDAVVRELDEENIRLVGSDDEWRERMFVDYYHGYRELSIWYLFVVEDTEIKPCHETIKTRWIEQREDLWYPSIREKILLNMKLIKPELVKAESLSHNLLK